MISLDLFELVQSPLGSRIVILNLVTNKARFGAIAILYSSLVPGRPTDLGAND
jgi:hypothetical protein